MTDYLLLLSSTLFFWPCHAACGILVPPQEMEPRPSPVRVQSPNTGPPGTPYPL